MAAERRSPLQNRVDPFGEIVATPDRGLFMGNRGGCFHNDDQTLTRRRWASRQWITCVLEWKGRKRQLMQPRLYTELFFLDEATALAAGHRPCFECRRADSNRFFDALRAGVPGMGGDGAKLYADSVDRLLHEERVDARTKMKRTTEALVGQLPDGAMVTLRGDAAPPHLLMGGKLFPWSFGGYGAAVKADRAEGVTVLTPSATLAALRAGYLPIVHPSAGV